MTSDLAARRDRLSPAQRALLAKRLSAASSGGAEEQALPAVPRREGGGPAPLSFAQERLWHHAREFPDRRAYNVLHSLGLFGPLRPPVLAAAFVALVERHEVLRTRFPEIDGELAALVEPASRVARRLPRIDLSALPAALAEDEGGRAGRAFGAPPFDLERGPIVRAALLSRSAGEHVLLLGAHHIGIDGWSLALCARDLSALYGALAEGRRPDLAAPLRQMADYASWERGRAAQEGAESFAAEVGWWRRRLAGVPVDGRVLPIRAGLPGGNSAFTLGPITAAEVRSFVQSERVTLFQVLLAALQAILLRRGAGEAAVATPFSLRARPELADQVGLLLNLVVLHVPLDEEVTFREAVVRAREAALGAFAHAEVPFELLAREIAPQAEPWRTPWVSVMINLPSGGAGHAEPITAAGVAFEPLATVELGTDFDLTLYARESPAGLRLDLGYGADLLTAEEGNLLLQELAAVIHQGCAQPDRRLADVFALLDALSGKGG
ncbi:MAG TPA: condensation domain-containing protein [Thermoanaerobaculia bacterium]|nr:condensation domain-containing protein [Thermoanaerobaculia bacterium]